MLDWEVHAPKLACRLGRLCIAFSHFRDFTVLFTGITRLGLNHPTVINLGIRVYCAPNKFVNFNVVLHCDIDA